MIFFKQSLLYKDISFYVLHIQHKDCPYLVEPGLGYYFNKLCKSVMLPSTYL